MVSTLKEKFEQYELLFTPLLLILIIGLIYYMIPQVSIIPNYFDYFLLPSLLGNITGIMATFLLDHYWKVISMETISDFIRMPTLILILFSSISTLLIIDYPYVSFSMLGFGLGAMFTVVCVTSLLCYYRSYYKTSQDSI